jgi:hypothetical protein
LFSGKHKLTVDQNETIFRIELSIQKEKLQA